MKKLKQLFKNIGWLCRNDLATVEPKIVISGTEMTIKDAINIVGAVKVPEKPIVKKKRDTGR